MAVTRVGVAGLNARGRAIGARLRSAGLRVVGFDRDIERAATSGLRTLSTIERFSEGCEITLVPLEGEEASQMIEDLLMAHSGFGGPQAIVLGGPVAPDTARQLSIKAEDQGVPLLDAAIEGGEGAVSAGQATVFAAGSDQALEICRPVLALCGTVLKTGAAGAAQVARIVCAALTWANMVTIVEAFRLAAACGTEPAGLRAAILHSGGASRALEDWRLEDVTSAAAAVAEALNLARQYGLELPALQALQQPAATLANENVAHLFDLGIADLSC